MAADVEVFSDRNWEIRFTALITLPSSVNIWMLIPLSSTYLHGCNVAEHYGLRSGCDVLMFIFVTNYMYFCTTDR